MGEKERKLKDRASRLYAEGKFKDALKLYEEILADDPAELQVRLKVGDLHRRIGNRSAAVDAYGGVAKAYAEDGLLLKAVAVCKMILALDANHTHTQNMLADLYSRRSAPPRFPAPPKSEAPPGLDYGLVDFDEDSAPSAPGRPPVAWSGTAPMARGPVEWPSGTPIARGTPVAPPVAWPKAASPAAPVAPSPPPVAWPATKPVAASISEASIKPKVSWPGTGVRVVQGAKVAPSIEDSVLDIVVEDDPMSRAVAEAAQEARQEAGLPVSSAVAAQASIEHSIELDMGSEGTWDQPVHLEDVDGPQQATQSVAAPVNELGLELGEVAALVAQELSGELVAPRFTEVEQVESPATEMEPRPEIQGLPVIPLFSDLPRAAFIELLVHMKMRELSPGELVMREGEVGDSFFVVASGQVRIFRLGEGGQELTLARLGDGAFFGEMALLQGGPRTASVVVEEDTQLFELERTVLERVVARYPSVSAVLRNFYKQRLLSTAMATHKLFAPFNQDERRALMEMWKSKQFARGEVLLEEGKKGAGLYLCLSGALEVSKKQPGGQVILAQLGAGDMFGEMSLITGQPTVATVTAVSDCFVLRLTKQKFDEVIMTHPQVLELVAAVSDERASLNDRLLGEIDPDQVGTVLV